MGSATETANDFGIPEFSCDTCECIELFAPRGYWEQKEKHEIDLLTINCIEVDRIFKASQERAFSELESARAESQRRYPYRLSRDALALEYRLI